MVRLLQITFLIFILLCLMLSAMPAQADEAAKNAVEQSFFNLHHLRSFRIAHTSIMYGFETVPHSEAAEVTMSPSRIYTTHNDAGSAVETVTSDGRLYIHMASYPWTVRSIGQMGKFERYGWMDDFYPDAAFRFVRKDAVDTTPVNVYAWTRVSGRKHEEEEVWIGECDHLPHKIVRRDTYAFERVPSFSKDVQIFSDFNAPITIIVPSVAH